MAGTAARAQPGRRDTEASPRELVARAQAGDTEAFGQLYLRYAPQVSRYLARRGLDATTVEDLTSETFLRAMRRIDGFSWQGRELTAWLFTIARNLLIDHVRSRLVHREIATGEIRARSAGVLPSAEDAALARLSAKSLQRILGELSGPQQRCITLRFFEGYSIAETARFMDRTPGAVKTLQYRGLRSLARLLENPGASDV